jgi:hypothetical protein
MCAIQPPPITSVTSLAKPQTSMRLVCCVALKARIKVLAPVIQLLEFSMCRHIENFQILNPIVCFYTVDMMNNFAGFKCATQMLFHNISMNSDHFPGARFPKNQIPFAQMWIAFIVASLFTALGYTSANKRAVQPLPLLDKIALCLESLATLQTHSINALIFEFMSALTRTTDSSTKLGRSYAKRLLTYLTNYFHDSITPFLYYTVNVMDCISVTLTYTMEL